MASVYIAGDSHVEVFKYSQKHIRDERINIIGSCMAPGKTAQGLHRSRNRQIFAKRIRSDFNRYKQAADESYYTIG